MILLYHDPFERTFTFEGHIITTIDNYLYYIFVSKYHTERVKQMLEDQLLP